MRPAHSQNMTVSYNQGWKTPRTRLQPSDEDKKTEMIRRKIEAIRDARDLGEELIEVWEL